MGLLALTGCTTWVHDRDYTTDSNKLSLKVDVEDRDATVFRPPTDPDAGWKTIKGGLKMVEADLEGLYDSAPDLASYANLAVADQVVTISPTSVEGDPVYAFQASRLSYQLLGQVGELAPFTLAAKGTNTVGAVRGQLAKARGDVSATGVLGSVLNLGNVGAAQYLYATLHVFTAGTTITVLLESDDNSGFSSATTRATLGPITTTGGTWAARVAGALAETHYRLRISAITGTFNVGAAIAIQ